MSAARASVVGPLCSAPAVDVFVRAVLSGEKQLSVLCAAHDIDCTECGRTAGACPSSRASAVTPFDAVVPAALALAKQDRARVADELPTLVACLAEPSGSLGTLAALAVAMPLTAAPLIAELDNGEATGRPPWQEAATLMMWPAVINFAAAGVASGHDIWAQLECADVGRASLTRGAAAAIEFGLWHTGAGTGSALALSAVRFALARVGLSPDVIGVIAWYAHLE
jgi:hypothetical protein